MGRWLDGSLLALSRFGRASVSYLVALALAPVLASSVYWYLAGPESRLKLLDTNKLAKGEQLLAFYYVAGAIGFVVLGLLLGYFGYARRKGLSFAWLASRTGALLTPLLAVPFMVALMEPGIEVDKRKPVITLLFCALIAAIIGVATYRIARSPRAEEKEGDAFTRSERRARILNLVGLVAAWTVVVGMWLTYGWFFGKMAITNHHAMSSRTFDLGLYDNIFYQSSHGRFLWCSFCKGGTHRSAHFDPILVLLSPLYLLYPRVEMILSLQTFWVGSGVIPVYLIANHHLKSRVQALLLAACYALHPALHGMTMYEFHSLTLAGVPILWTLYFLQTKRLKLYWLALCFALSVREDIPLMMAMVGVAAMLLPDGTLRRTGFFTFILCACYFVLTKGTFMTAPGVLESGAESYSFNYYYADMMPEGKKGVLSLILSVFTNPSFTLRHALTEPKVLYLLKIFLPLLFLPFAVRSWRVTLFYGLAFTLLATRTAVFSTHFQYSTALLPFAFAAAPMALRNLTDGTLARAYGLNAPRLQRALVFAALAASAGVSYKFGAIFENQSFRGGFARVVRKLTPEQEAHYTWVEETKALIPPRASVGVTQKMGPHVSNRKDVFLYGQKFTQFVFIDEKELKGDRQKKHKKAIEPGCLEEQRKKKRKKGAEGNCLELLAKRGTYALYTIAKPKPKETKPEPPPIDGDEVGEDGEDGVEDPRDVLGDEPHE